MTLLISCSSVIGRDPFVKTGFRFAAKPVSVSWRKWIISFRPAHFPWQQKVNNMDGGCRALLLLLVFDELFEEYDDDAHCIDYQGNFCNVVSKCVSITSAGK